MTSLRDIKETSDVNYKQIHDYYRKNIAKDVLELKSEIVKEVLAVKTRNRRTPISTISKNMNIPETTVRSYMKEMDQVKARRHLTTSQKNESQMKMQLGKAKARYNRNELSERDYKSKVETIKKKYSDDPMTGGTFHMKATDSDDDTPKVITEEEAQRRIRLAEARKQRLTKSATTTGHSTSLLIKDNPMNQINQDEEEDYMERVK